MLFRKPAPSAPKVETSAAPVTPAEPSLWETSVEVDLHLTLALCRASVNALMKLSPHAAAVVRDALAAEVDALQSQNDPHSLAAAGGVLELLDDAA